MKLSNKFFAGIVITFFLLANLFVIFTGHESFPFTQAPMFGHYIGPATHFYDFKFIGENGITKTTLYPGPEYKSSEPNLYYRTLRLFFKFYGSVEENSSFGYYVNDSKEKFEQRMTNFFSAYFKYLDQGDPNIQTVQLEINQYDRSYQLKDSHTVGYYDVLSKKFISTWKSKE